METILLKILEVQNEILAEMRLLRKAVTQGQPLAPAAPAPVAATPPPQAPDSRPAETAPPRREQPGGMLTMNELADLGGQFLEPDQRPRARVKPVDASDLSGSILDEIKAKNKAKRSAFSEFDKFNRDR
jgi:pyruvate/2-oxoglutarate dehydrogenase complex dihydrolipoamide acyltransferase (E2) component